MSRPDISRPREVVTESCARWPAVPAVYDDYADNLSWRVRNEPERLTQADLEQVGWVIRSYYTLVDLPVRLRNSVIRDLRADQAAARHARGARPDEETGEWMTPEDLR